MNQVRTCINIKTTPDSTIQNNATRLQSSNTIHTQDDNGEPVNEQHIRKTQSAVGKFLYYARAIDITMQHAVNDISTKSKKGTTSTKEAVQYFMDYAYHNRDTEIIF